ncbi:unnamed protein product [Pelagomonas calceolata]|uniref:MYND-type domain-containing protein n=1 Tax=Pelagomonas calceolata TaxID=35677 RepID=A0A8J2X2S2_9STRA|nr:unnamed protein product [Pelagomonas calceolata]
MILTHCAVCATDLGLTRGKKCGRCSTRYCGAACQVQHWKEGGHDQLCKKIKRSGGAEQYNADQRYTKAVAVAAEACAEDTKGQTCYICTQALHWKTKEGLVRGCSCRGTAGFVHVSCLAEQAKILVAEAEENHLDDKLDERWARWNTCSLCEQEYHGVVACALGWACWKTYLGLSETDQVRLVAMDQLGNGLHEAGNYEALSVREAILSMLRRIGSPEDDMLAGQSNLASSYEAVGRVEECLRIRRDVYSGRLRLHGEEHLQTLLAANNYATSLVQLQHFEEAKTLLRRITPVARRVLGDNHDITLKMRFGYAASICFDTGSTLDDLRGAVTTLEETARTARRVLGGAHPLTTVIERQLRASRATLSARDSDVGSITEAFAAMTPSPR